MNDKTKKNQSIKLQETPIFLKSGFSGVPINSNLNFYLCLCASVVKTVFSLFFLRLTPMRPVGGAPPNGTHSLGEGW